MVNNRQSISHTSIMRSGSCASHKYSERAHARAGIHKNCTSHTHFIRLFYLFVQNKFSIIPLSLSNFIFPLQTRSTALATQTAKRLPPSKPAIILIISFTHRPTALAISRIASHPLCAATTGSNG